jgi:hypothetical protein
VGATTGPLYRFVSGATASAATGWHKQWGQWLIIALVVLHVAAIAYYRWGRGTDLVGPMWHGDKPGVLSQPASADGLGERVKAAVIMAAAGALALWIGSLAT